MEVGKRYRLKDGLEENSGRNLAGKYFIVTSLDFEEYVTVKLDGSDQLNHIRRNEWGVLVEENNFNPIRSIRKLSLTV